jgi:hypothetical protein
MNQAREADTWHMPGMGIEPRNVPNRLLRQRKMIGQEAAAIFLGEKAVEAP